MQIPRKRATEKQVEYIAQLFIDIGFSEPSRQHAWLKMEFMIQTQIAKGIKRGDFEPFISWRD